MIEKYMPMDRRHNDFYERFMEQRIQKINNPEQSGMEDSLPVPTEHFRTAPVTLPPKRVSNHSSDSGVNSPRVLLPSMPIIPDNSQPYLIPSTLRMNPPRVTLTPIQQFINFSRKSKNKEPKYNRSQPDHPDPQSVLRTRTWKGYKLWILIPCMVFILFSLIWLSVYWNSPGFSNVFSLFYSFLDYHA